MSSQGVTSTPFPSIAPSLKAELLTYMTSPAGTPTNSIFSSHKPNLPKQSINMLRTITRNTFTKTFKPSSASALRTRGMADKKVEDAAQAAGEAKDTNPQNPSVISSAGAIGKQFNPDGNIGQVGEKVRSPPSSTSLRNMTDNVSTDRRRFLQGRCHRFPVRRFQGWYRRPGREGCRRPQQTCYSEEVNARPDLTSHSNLSRRWMPLSRHESTRDMMSTVS